MGEIEVSSAQESASQKRCRLCLESIISDAKVCHHCGRHQNKYIAHFGEISTVISILMLAVSIGMLILARGENIKASEALKEAQAATGKADMAGTKAENAAQNAINAIKQGKDLHCELIRVGFLLFDYNHDMLYAIRIMRAAHPDLEESAILKMNTLMDKLEEEKLKVQCHQFPEFSLPVIKPPWRRIR